MDGATKRMAQGLQKAIQAEIEGEHFYRMAAGSTKDAQGKETFLRLAEEEVHHQRILEAQLRSLLETGGADASARPGPPPKLEGSSPIFSAKLKDRIQEAHFEMTALAVGIQLELGAMRFYREQAEEATLPELRSFFLEMAEWEDGHYEALLRQQEALKEDFWSAAGFSPF